jgi:hypothetical protein
VLVEEARREMGRSARKTAVECGGNDSRSDTSLTRFDDAQERNAPVELVAVDDWQSKDRSVEAWRAICSSHIAACPRT